MFLPALQKYAVTYIESYAEGRKRFQHKAVEFSSLPTQGNVTLKNNLVVILLLRKFPFSYTAWNFIPVLTVTSHWILTWPRLIHSTRTPTHCVFNISFMLYLHICIRGPSYHFLSDSPTKICVSHPWMHAACPKDLISVSLIASSKYFSVRFCCVFNCIDFLQLKLPHMQSHVTYQVGHRQMIHARLFPKCSFLTWPMFTLGLFLYRVFLFTLRCNAPYLHVLVKMLNIKALICKVCCC